MNKRARIVVVSVIVLFVVLLIVKPTISLPAINMSADTYPFLANTMEKSGLSGLEMRVRTDGEVHLDGDGKALATINYSIRELINLFSLAASAFLPGFVRWLPLVGLTLFPRTTVSLAMMIAFFYYIIPLEIVINVMA